MLAHYRKMVDDPLRIDHFARAIAATVRPGDVVVDAGCGLGTYAIFACRAGARRVYAIDSSPILQAAREVAMHNGCADRVTFMSGMTGDLAAPERARVVIFEDYQSAFFVPGTLAIVRDLCARWLAPGGVLLPGRVRVWVAPAHDAEGHAAIDCLAPHGEHVAGVDFAPTRRRVFASLHNRFLTDTCLVGEPSLVAEVDLAMLEPTLALSRTSQVTALRDDDVHGLLVWFDLELAGEWLGTGPRSPRSAWAQTLLPFETPLRVAAHEPLELALDAAPFGEAALWRWSLGNGAERAEGNSLAGMLMRPDSLALSRPDRVPVVADALAIDRFVLALVDGSAQIGEIAAALRAQFPGRFVTLDDAHRRVAQVLASY